VLSLSRRRASLELPLCKSFPWAARLRKKMILRLTLSLPMQGNFLRPLRLFQVIWMHLMRRLTQHITRWAAS
jgi:hypothetical protein